MKPILSIATQWRSSHKAMGIGLSLGCLTSATVALLSMTHNAASAAELNGFRLESQSDGSLSVQVQADTLPAYDIEPSGNGVSILLKDTHLSDSLRQKGLPVVIDNRNRAIGRAVPGDGNTVKIVIPNWKPEQGALRVKADTGASSESPRILPKPSTAPSERLSGAFQSQFKSAAQALSRPSTSTVDETSVSLPAVESEVNPRTTASKTAPPRRKKVSYRPVAITPTALPKVVNWSQPESTANSPTVSPKPSSESPLSASQYTAGASSTVSSSSVAPRGAVPWPVVVQPPPTAESTGWGSYAQSDSDNPYGIDSVAEAIIPSASSTAPSMGSQLKQFFDGITGNRFSKPYGVAFWAMMVGVIFVACLGFLALAIGLLCTRLVFTPLHSASHSEAGTTRSNKGNRLFAWRNDAPDDTSHDSSESNTNGTTLRGPVAKRFPFVASGLSQTASMYVPHSVGNNSHEPVLKRSIRPRPQVIQTPVSITAPQQSSSSRLIQDTPERLDQTEPKGHTNPFKPTTWRPHVATPPPPTSPAHIHQSKVTAESRMDWSHPADDRDLIPSTHRPAMPSSPVERALHRLSF